MYALLAIVICTAGGIIFCLLKSTLVKSFVMFVASLIATVIAFGFYEIPANMMTGYGYGGAWVFGGLFFVLFVLSFAILREIGTRLIYEGVDIGDLPDKIGRAVFGAAAGFVIAGVVLTAVAMLPLPRVWPYGRFDSPKMSSEQADAPASPIAIERPKNPLPFSPDGMIAGFFKQISQGAFHGSKSFAVIWPNFIDQAFLNRHKIHSGVSNICGKNAITVEKAWQSKENLVPIGGPASQKTAGEPVIVRIGFSPATVGDGGIADAEGNISFTPAQIRLLCKNKSAAGDLKGSAIAVYPAGFIKSGNQVQLKELSEQINIDRAQMSEGQTQIDFVFYVPRNDVPVLVGFKNNCFVKVRLAGEDEIPATISYIQASKCTNRLAEINPISSAILYGTKLAAGPYFLGEIGFEPTNLQQFQDTQKIFTGDMGLEISGSGDKIACAQVRLLFEQGQLQDSRTPGDYGDSSPLGALMSAPAELNLISLKCNNPPVGSPIIAAQYPVLIDITGNKYKPIGVAAQAVVDNKPVVQIEFCSLKAEEFQGGLQFDNNGSPVEAFPAVFNLPQEASEIKHLYFIYAIKPGIKSAITRIGAGGTQETAALKDYEGFTGGSL